MSNTKLLSLAFIIAATVALHTQHLATNSSTCQPPGHWNTSNNTCTCLNGSTLNTTSGSCQCPSSYPWLHNGSCLPCNYPDVFDPSSKQCMICPFGYSYNITLFYCQLIVCPPGQAFNSTTNNCSCPSLTPYNYNNSCHKCPPNNYILKGHCQPCFNGSFLNSTTQQCQCNTSLGQFPNSNNATACIGCYFPHYFNFN
jgi:hypothetical protein